MILSQYPNPLGLSPLSSPNQAASSTYTANVHFKSILAIKSIKKKKKILLKLTAFCWWGMNYILIAILYSPVPNNREGGGGPRDNLNISKRRGRGANKREDGSEKCSWSKVAAHYH